ncbi:hypothetical protein AB0F93_03560 [Micromonospora tulbaghiae]|uniref:hypothetical protein n=1 Tax=Micromonospora tulbaghiae TaxID=479978 RepID=UPI003334428C
MTDVHLAPADDITAAYRARDAAETARDHYRARMEAVQLELAAVTGQRDNAAFRAGTHAGTLMEIVELLDSGKTGTELTEAIRATIRQGRSAQIERPRPRTTPPAAVTVDRMHFGLSATGNDIEQQCPCPLAPCGLVLDIDADEACPHHGRWAEMSIKQIHPAQSCPAGSAHRPGA